MRARSASLGVPWRRVARFCALAAVTYGALLAAWGLVDGAYRGAFLGCAGAAFGDFGDDRVVSFVPTDEAQRTHADAMIVPHLRTARASRTAIALSTFRHGYLPTAFFLALALATPLPARRRLRAAAVGLVAVQGFVALRLGLAIAFGFSTVRGPDGAMAIQLGERTKSVLFAVTEFLWQEPHTTYVVPLVVWSLVALRRPAVSSAESPAAGRGAGSRHPRP